MPGIPEYDLDKQKFGSGYCGGKGGADEAPARCTRTVVDVPRPAPAVSQRRCAKTSGLPKTVNDAL